MHLFLGHAVTDISNSELLLGQVIYLCKAEVQDLLICAHTVCPLAPLEKELILNVERCPQKGICHLKQQKHFFPNS